MSSNPPPPPPKGLPGFLRRSLRNPYDVNGGGGGSGVAGTTTGGGPPPQVGGGSGGGRRTSAGRAVGNSKGGGRGTGFDGGAPPPVSTSRGKGGDDNADPVPQNGAPGETRLASSHSEPVAVGAGGGDGPLRWMRPGAGAGGRRESSSDDFAATEDVAVHASTAPASPTSRKTDAAAAAGDANSPGGSGRTRLTRAVSDTTGSRSLGSAESSEGDVSSSVQSSSGNSSGKSYKETTFERTISADVVNLRDLRRLGWNGIPPQYRADSWKILLGYLPANASRRKATLTRKRADYADAIRQHYLIDDGHRTVGEQETLRQVLVDVPRTAPEVGLFRNDRVRRCLERLLYIWAMRHPASSYVQGINDLVTPLFVVFLSGYFGGEDVMDGTIMERRVTTAVEGRGGDGRGTPSPATDDGGGGGDLLVTDEIISEIEADCYWCLTKLLAGIQDHYTCDQPGVQRMVARLEELVRRIDADLCRYLRDMGIEFMQFAFKWMNCLLLREFSLGCVVRLWDTYLSEGDGGFENFHVYVCAAFLCQFSAEVQTMEFDELFGFMQNMPTDDWGDKEVEVLLSQAYVLSTLFGGSDAHLNRPDG